MSGATCYYPNGAVSTGDIPCGDGDGVACCPQGWSCEANGLCHLADPFYYGRYTCTDKSWESEGCPNVCTQGNTAAGAEAVIECSSGSYCCDANRPDALPDGTIDSSKDCCHTSNDRFPLAQLPLAPGYSADNEEPDSSSSSSSTSADESTSSSTSSSTRTRETSFQTRTPPTSQSTTSSRRNTRSSDTAGPSTQVITSIITTGAGGSSTLVTTTSAGAALPASDTPSPTSSSSNSKNLGPIVGPAVAVPLAVLLLAALALFLFLRRRRRHSERPSSPPPMGDNLQPMYGNDAKDLVDSPYTGKSELEGSPSPNTAVFAKPSGGNGDGNGYHMPSDVGVAGATRESKSELSASNSTTAARSPRSRLSEMQGSPTIGETMEKAQPAELPGSESQGDGYKPYRPPGLGLS